MKKQPTNKYSDDWFAQQAGQLEIAPGNHLFGKIMEKKHRRALHVRRLRWIGATAATVLLLIVFYLMGLRPPSSQVQWSSISLEESSPYYTEYRDFISSSTYSKIKRAYEFHEE